jgi:hypothetical protein
MRHQYREWVDLREPVILSAMKQFVHEEVCRIADI